MDYRDTLRKPISDVSVTVLGAGTWGVALAKMLREMPRDVTVWSALPSEIGAITKNNRHPFLPDVEMPEGIRYTLDGAEACAGGDVLLAAVASPYMRSTIESLRPYITDRHIVAVATKGIEADTLMTMSQVVRDVMGEEWGGRVVAISGPTHAEEVAVRKPTTMISACADSDAAGFVQQVLTCGYMRVYTSTDIVGVEICGALKNIIALASGISRGLGYGDNAVAALITRGAAQIAELLRRMGCSMQTCSGLAGVGDLIVTCISMHSRNNRCGQLIGGGMSPDDAVREVGMVVEGINALPAAMALQETYGVKMKIADAVNDVINGGKPARQAAEELMRGELKAEFPEDTVGYIGV